MQLMMTDMGLAPEILLKFVQYKCKLSTANHVVALIIIMD